MGIESVSCFFRGRSFITQVKETEAYSQQSKSCLKQIEESLAKKKASSIFDNELHNQDLVNLHHDVVACCFCLLL